MKKLGMIGGLTWKNTIEYYDKINKAVNQIKGGWNSAEIILYSVNFEEVYIMQSQGKWDLLAQEMIKIANNLHSASADAVFLCSNTLHKIADRLAENIKIPIIHVVDAVAEELKNNKIQSVLLLGTKSTMESTFYPKKLEKEGISVTIPEAIDRERINKIIYSELSQFKINEDSKAYLISLIKKYPNQGIGGIILGCTELPLIILPNDSPLPLFDTMEIHIQKAVDFILQ